MFKKKVIGLTLAALMIGCMGASVSAHETNDVVAVSEIMPRGAICSDCGMGQMIKRSTVYGPYWYFYDEVACSHHAHGVDEIQRKDTLTTWTCSYCNAGLTSSGYITQTICHGY